MSIVDLFAQGPTVRSDSTEDDDENEGEASPVLSPRSMSLAAAVQTAVPPIIEETIMTPRVPTHGPAAAPATAFEPASELGGMEPLPPASAPEPACKPAPPSAQLLYECRSCGRDVEQTCSANGCCAACLADIHDAEQLGHTAITKAEAAEAERIGGDQAFGYGEITPLGMRTLGTTLSLAAEDVFADLGSGTGRLVLQVAREFGVCRSVGVELVGSRHRLALAALERAPELAGRVVFVRGNCACARLWGVADDDPDPEEGEGAARAQDGSSDSNRPKTSKGRKVTKHVTKRLAVQLRKKAAATAAAATAAAATLAAAPPATEEADVSLAAAPTVRLEGALVGVTAILLNSLLFSPVLMGQLARLIERCPTLRVVASTQGFVEDPDTGCCLAGYMEMPSVRVETSWMAPTHVDNPLRLQSPGSPVRIYVRGTVHGESAREGARMSSACGTPATALEMATHRSATMASIVRLAKNLGSLESEADRLASALDEALERLMGAKKQEGRSSRGGVA